MARNPETKVKFSVFNQEFNEGISEMTRESTKLKKEFKLQEAQMKDTGTAAEKLEAKISYLGKEQDIVRRKIQATEQQLEKAKQTYGENSNEANKLSNKLLDLRISEQKLENSINQSRTEISKQAQDMQAASGDVDKYKKSLKEVASEASGVGDKLNTGVTLPLAGIGAVAGKSAMDISGAVRLMNGSLGATGEEAKQLEQDMRTVWSDGFGDNPEHVARSMMMVKQNIKGIDEGEELQKATKNILLLADATESDLGEATRGVNQLMHNFGLTADEAMDLFKKGQEEGLNYSNEMFDNISEYAPLFKQMGFSAEEYFTVLANGAQNGAYNLDYINDLMKEFDIRVRDGSDKTTDAFGEMSKETQNLFKEFEKGEATTEELFKAVIPELEDMEDQVKANQIGVELFGTKFEDMGTDTVYALDDVNDSMKNVEGAMDDFAQSQEQAFSRELKQTIRGVTEALEPLGRELLDIAQEITPKIQELSEWFVELDDDTQKFLLTMAGSAAFIGPALKIFGSLSSVVGGLGGKFKGAKNAAGAKGFGGVLLSLVSRAGPIGLGVTAITGLGLAIGALTKKEDELKEVSLENYNSMMKQHESTGAMIERMEQLRGESELTSDEFARYVDLQAELENANSQEAIEAIKDEMASLQEKSGFSNDELNEMVGLNQSLVENLPGATSKITDQGQEIAGTTDKMKDLNRELLQSATLKLENNFMEAANQYNDLLSQRETIQGRLNTAQQREQEISSLLNNYNKQDAQALAQQYNEEVRIVAQKLAKGGLSKQEIENLTKEQELLGQVAYALGQGKEETKQQLSVLKEKTNEEQISLNKKDVELSKLGQIYQKLQLQYLKNAGINEELARKAVHEGTSLQTLDKQIEKLQKQKEKIQETTPENEKNTQKYRDQIEALEGQISEMQTAKSNLIDLGGEAQDYTEELGKDVSKYVNSNLTEEQRDAIKYNKTLRERILKTLGIDPNPSAGEIDSDLSKTSYKTVEISTQLKNASSVLSFYDRMNNYAKGTDFHPGGPAMVGEEGPELIREGNKWSLAGFGIIPNLKRGADVFTHEQTKKILSGFNRLPAYAGGVGVSSSMARSIENMGSSFVDTRQNINNNVNINVDVGDVIMDGRVVGNIVWKPVKENIDRDKKIKNSFRGR